MAKKSVRPASSSEYEDASGSDNDQKSTPAAPAAATFSDDEGATSDEQPSNVNAKSSPPKEDSESEEEDDEEDDEESESDEEETEHVIKKAEPLNSIPPETKPPSESSEGDSESDSGSDKPAAEAPTAKESTTESNGKSLFERIWSFEDEIKLLEGLAEYESEHGPIKSSAIGEFHAYIQKSLSFPCSATQVLDKSRRLKKRLLRLTALAKKGGELKLKPHDLTMYELGKKVWGEGEEAVEEVGAGRKGLKREREFPFLKERVLSLGNKFFPEKRMKLIGTKKAQSLENRLKKQKVIEMNHEVHKMGLLKKSMQLVMEGVERAMEAMEE